MILGRQPLTFLYIYMKQHPVPQNVTTFQFRLIGDMTIKQFGYLAGGAILAYIFYKLPLPFFFTWPLAITSAVGGFGFAFIPIEERPMDVWVFAFIKSVYSPTLFVWSRTQPAPPSTTKSSSGPAAPPNRAVPPAASRAVQSPSLALPKKSTADALQGIFRQAPKQTAPPAQSGRPTAPPQQPARILPKQPDFFSSLFGSLFPKKKPRQSVHQEGQDDSSSSATPTPSITGRHLDLSTPPAVGAMPPETVKQAADEVQKKEEQLESKLHDLQKELQSKTVEQSRIVELQKQLTEVLAERERMEAELVKLRQQMEAQAAPTAAPVAVAPSPHSVAAQGQPAHVAFPATPKQPTIKVITPETAVKAGLPRLTTFPNVVTGIIKDSEHNFLPGVLVTVRDKDGVPLRALKTNRLGQFAASTPLPNGTYFVEIEDPRGRFTFDRVQITLNGSVVPALEIVAKSQKELARAQLEKEIFGNQMT